MAEGTRGKVAVADPTLAADDAARAWAPRSWEHYQRAAKAIPGGTFRIRFWWPNPIYVERGEGAYFHDVDGHRYIDCNLGFGPLILGHSHPEVVAAIKAQVDRGLMFPNAGEAELAERIVANVPGASWSVFFNSGTEATMAAVRIARAATGRQKVAKFEGGWHGWHDFLLFSTQEIEGPPALAASTPSSAGIPERLADLLVVLPFNDPAAFERIRREAPDLAAVIVEPVQGAAGVLPSDAGFLAELTELCRQYGILVIFDEVITGFRVGPGGGAAHYGVQADMTTLGKVIGGGLPVGGLAGRAELHDVMTEGVGGQRVVLGGTFSSNPVTMAAGAAQLDVLLRDPEIYDRLTALGERMRDGLNQVFAEGGHAIRATGGVGGMWGTHYGTTAPPRSRREARHQDRMPGQLLHHYLMREGVAMSAPVHLSFLSAAHTEADVDRVVDAHRVALAGMASDGVLKL